MMNRTAGSIWLATAGLALLLPFGARAAPEEVVFRLESPAIGATTTCWTGPIVFPEALRAKGIQGTVRVVLHLTATGSISSAGIATSSGNYALDTAALEPMRAAKCEPLWDAATMQAVAGDVYPRIRFILAEADEKPASTSAAAPPPRKDASLAYNDALTEFIRAAHFSALMTDQLDKGFKKMPEIIETVPRDALIKCLNAKLTPELMDQVIRPAVAQVIPSDTALLRDLTELFHTSFADKAMGSLMEGKSIDDALFTPAEIRQGNTLMAKPRIAQFFAEQGLARILNTGFPYFAATVGQSRGACIRALKPPKPSAPGKAA